MHTHSILLTAALFAAHVSLAAASWNPLDIITQLLPCTALRLSRPSWTTTYFEPSIIPLSVQNISQARLEALVADENFTCGDVIPVTAHTLTCSPAGFTFVPPRPARFALIFLHGIVPPGSEASLIPVLARLLATDPQLGTQIRVEFPLYQFRRITFSSFNTPPVPVARAYFDLLPPPAGFTAEDLIAAQNDRLGLFRAAQFVDFVVRSQMCKASIPPSRVALFGHSLGGFTVLETVMATGLNLAGALVLSGSLPRAGDYVQPGLQAFDTRSRSFNVSMIHATGDDIIPFAFANLSAQILRPIFSSLGGGFTFTPLQGLDHFVQLFADSQVYELMTGALRQAFLR